MPACPGPIVAVVPAAASAAPTIAMARKMARRMSRFIRVAMGAATEAVDRAGLDFSAWTAEQRDRAGVARPRPVEPCRAGKVVQDS